VKNRGRILIWIVLLTGITLHLFSQYNFNVKRTFGETSHQVVFATYSPDGKFIATAGSDSSIIIWNTDRLTIYRTLTGLEARPNVAVISTDNRYLFSGGKDNKVSMWDLTGMPAKIVRSFKGQKGAIKTIDVTSDGLYLASGSTDGSIMIWDIGSSNLVYELLGNGRDVNALAFSPDGKILASGGADGTVILWNTGNGSIMKSQEGHKGWIRDVDFSPDGKLLATCGDDKLLRTWELPGLTQSGIFKGHKDWVQTLDFTPDSKNLISGGRDKLILLWDVASQSLLAESVKQEQIVTCVDISPGKPDFISSCFGSEVMEAWALSGLDETQWRVTFSITEEGVQSPEPGFVSEVESTATPIIEIFSPVPLEGRIVHEDKSIDLIGRVNDPDGISLFLINKAVIELTESGVFLYRYDLAKGENQLEMVVVNKRGKINELRLVVDCTALDAPLVGSEVTVNSEGKYYALLIGINDYQDPDISDLDNPVRDAESLYKVLLSKYTFDEGDIVFLKNPTQALLISTLDEFTGLLTFKDNLLIFYAGHGYWDEKGKVGYWFPTDASRNSTVNWFRNSTLRDFIGSIESRHTLLIADACFSGAIFKTRAAFSDAPKGIEKLNQLPSRKAMTSGILEEVPDKSIFLEYLVKRLEENEDKYLTSELLFSSFKASVMNNSPNVPQFGVIQNVGDEGGDFVFVRR
jgi:WD40 repeat protein